MTRRADFGERLRQGALLAGAFQKLPSYQAVEILGRTGLDFGVLDAEHAPFDASQIDASVMASHLIDFPLMVRVPKNDPATILSALDMGAAGIFVPHVVTAEQAKAAASACFYTGGTRGFSPSTRAGGYGARGLRDYMDAADREVALVLQIEDGAALQNLDSIAAIKGVSGLFVGRADLAASMELDWNDPRLDDATRQTADAAKAAGIAAGAYLADTTRLAEFRNWGVSFFVIGSDQGALKSEFAKTSKAFLEVCNATQLPR